VVGDHGVAAPFLHRVDAHGEALGIGARRLGQENADQENRL